MEDQKICSLCDSWIDLALSDSQRIVFETHLDHCDECRSKIQRWQDFEHELVAACRLFGSSQESDALTGERLFDAVPKMEVVSAATRASEKASLDVDRKSRWLSDDYRMWTAAAILMFAAILGWIAFGKSNYSNQHEIVSGAGNSCSSAVNPADSETLITEAKPAIEIKVHEPVIASAPVTTPRFTVINVYPVFAVAPSNQAN